MVHRFAQIEVAFDTCVTVTANDYTRLTLVKECGMEEKKGKKKDSCCWFDPVKSFQNSWYSWGRHCRNHSFTAASSPESEKMRRRGEICFQISAHSFPVLFFSLMTKMWCLQFVSHRLLFGLFVVLFVKEEHKVFLHMIQNSGWNLFEETLRLQYVLGFLQWLPLSLWGYPHCSRGEWHPNYPIFHHGKP